MCLTNVWSLKSYRSFVPRRSRSYRFIFFLFFSFFFFRRVTDWYRNELLIRISFLVRFYNGCYRVINRDRGWKFIEYSAARFFFIGTWRIFSFFFFFFFLGRGKMVVKYHDLKYDGQFRQAIKIRDGSITEPVGQRSTKRFAPPPTPIYGSALWLFEWTEND